jgi:hypothetical protein
MAKNTITKEELKSGTVLMDAASFNAQKGQLYAGKNVLKLEPGQAAGPFTLTEILKDQDLGSKGKKKLQPVTVYVAEGPDGNPWHMPVATAFRAKAEDAKLAVGDTFAVLRTEDYTSREFGTKGHGYQIKVLSRA